MIPYGSLVIYLTPKGKRYLKRLTENSDWHTNDGSLPANTVAAANFGDVVFTSQGMPVRILEATLEDKIMGIKRQTQIIYPKDIAFICLRLGAGPGRTICEAGCGSGGLTLALSWYCGPTGKVVSQDYREEFVKLARRNLDWANVGANVELYCRNLEEGFPRNDADAVFIDVREPWLFLEQIAACLKPGGIAGFLAPTVNQISELCTALELQPFCEPEIIELLVRRWKPLPDRLRPFDRMAAHTSFLMFCRKCSPCQKFADAGSHGTRERKQEAAKLARLSEAY